MTVIKKVVSTDFFMKNKLKVISKVIIGKFT